MTRGRIERVASQEAGFTLAEVLISLLLALIAASVMAAFNRFQLFALTNQTVQLDVQGTARAITDLVSSEIRRAGLNATRLGIPGLRSMQFLIVACSHI